MPLTKEEIEAIANKVAERVVSKHSICDCGCAAWQANTATRLIEDDVYHRRAKSIEASRPLNAQVLDTLEEGCRIDTSKVRSQLENLYDQAQSDKWEQARDTATALRESVENELYSCAREESNPGRVRFDRASIDSAIEASKRLKSDRDLYVFATYLGYTIDKRAPPGVQSYVLVHPDGTTETIKPGSSPPPSYAEEGAISAPLS